MTYNFDPDRWFDNQRRLVDARRDRGELNADEYQRELDALEARYESLTSRLDKAFELPDASGGSPSGTRPGRGPRPQE